MADDNRQETLNGHLNHALSLALAAAIVLACAMIGASPYTAVASLLMLAGFAVLKAYVNWNRNSDDR